MKREERRGKRERGMRKRGEGGERYCRCRRKSGRGRREIL